MKVVLACVGRPGRLLEGAIREYEERAGRYWPLEVVEVKAERGSRGEDEVRRAESERLLARLPDGVERIALTPEGRQWSSEKLSAHLQNLGLASHPGAAFLIGGACGLSQDLLAGATRTLSLSDMTMPHDVARLVLAEQLYRAGTIMRNEPYHKG